MQKSNTGNFANPAKRLRSDVVSDEDLQPRSPVNTFSRFVVVQTLDGEPQITKLSPFVVEKTISGILGTPKSIKNLRNGTLLVECATQYQTKNLLAINQFFNHKAKAYPHPTLNSSRGVDIPKVDAELQRLFAVAVQRPGILLGSVKLMKSNVQIVNKITSQLQRTVPSGKKKRTFFKSNTKKMYRSQMLEQHMKSVPK